jgi:hypothetical protein
MLFHRRSGSLLLFMRVARSKSGRDRYNVHFERHAVEEQALAADGGGGAAQFGQYVPHAWCERYQQKTRSTCSGTVHERRCAGYRGGHAGFWCEAVKLCEAE